MIDIRLFDDMGGIQALIYLNELTLWLLNEVKLTIDEKNSYLGGILMVCDQQTGKYSCLIICEGKTQTKIQTLLQQPPENLKKKYNSYILHDEPECVKEVKDDKSEEDDDEGILFKNPT